MPSHLLAADLGVSSSARGHHNWRVQSSGQRSRTRPQLPSGLHDARPRRRLGEEVAGCMRRPEPRPWASGGSGGAVGRLPGARPAPPRPPAPAALERPRAQPPVPPARPRGGRRGRCAAAAAAWASAGAVSARRRRPSSLAAAAAAFPPGAPVPSAAAARFLLLLLRSVLPVAREGKAPRRGRPSVGACPPAPALASPPRQPPAQPRSARPPWRAGGKRAPFTSPFAGLALPPAPHLPGRWWAAAGWGRPAGFSSAGGKVALGGGGAAPHCCVCGRGCSLRAAAGRVYFRVRTFFPSPPRPLLRRPPLPPSPPAPAPAARARAAGTRKGGAGPRRPSNANDDGSRGRGKDEGTKLSPAPSGAQPPRRQPVAAGARGAAAGTVRQPDARGRPARRRQPPPDGGDRPASGRGREGRAGTGVGRPRPGGREGWGRRAHWRRDGTRRARRPLRGGWGAEDGAEAARPEGCGARLPCGNHRQGGRGPESRAAPCAWCGGLNASGGRAAILDSSRRGAGSAGSRPGAARPRPGCGDSAGAAATAPGPGARPRRWGGGRALRGAVTRSPAAGSEAPARCGAGRGAGENK